MGLFPVLTSMLLVASSKRVPPFVARLLAMYTAATLQSTVGFTSRQHAVYISCRVYMWY